MRSLNMPNQSNFNEIQITENMWCQNGVFTLTAFVKSREQVYIFSIMDYYDWKHLVFTSEKLLTLNISVNYIV